MTSTSPLGPSAALILFLALVLVLAVLYLYRRRQAKPTPRTPEHRSPAAGTSWTPPTYAAPPPTPSGPSLKVGVSLLRLEGDSLLVSWTAVNDGTVPLQVQWGPPAIQLAGDDLKLSYVCEPIAIGGDATFTPPAMRLAQPGEIISRSAQLSSASVGRPLAGLRLTVALGYGPTDGYPAPSVTPEAYLAWQRVALSQPRTVR